MANVYRNNKWIKVKNLGWLLRHASEVEKIFVYQATEPKWACFMVVDLKDNVRYQTHWADATVCKQWLHRPSLRGLPLYWINHDTVC